MIRACRRCGKGPSACRCRRRAVERRSYSSTAAERAMRIAVLETYGTGCYYAGVDPECPGGDVDPNRFHLAHVQAHADGGLFVLENLRPAHGPCNLRAGRR